MDWKQQQFKALNITSKKNAKKLEFFCPLCSAPRVVRNRSKLSLNNYMQILVFTICTGVPLYSVMHEKVVVLFFINWIFFEAINKMLFRKQIPCPDCGFDATWYRKDVKVARQKVQNFWDSRNSAAEK